MDNNVNFEPIENTLPDPSETRENIKKKAKSSYNMACMPMLIQLLIASVISSFMSSFYASFVVVQAMLENINAAPEVLFEILMEKAMTAALDPMFLLVTNTVAFLAANLISYFIGIKLTNKHHRVELFGKIKMKPLDCILAVVSIIGIQMASAIVQYVVTLVTGLSGVDETTAGLLSFSDNILQNILLILYAVVIAAITEELLCRGAVMKGMAPISPTFALIASSLLFGLMHGNFNQMFNGFVLGMVIGYAALKSRSIFLPIILHMCANGHAMILSYFEYSLGEDFRVIELIYMGVMALVGIGAAVWLVLRNGLPKKTDGYPVISTIEGVETLPDTRGMTWRLLFKSPMFWIIAAYYVGTAFFMMILASFPSIM